MKFTKRDFAIITGIKYTSSVDEFLDTDETPSRLMQTFFLGAYTSVKKSPSG